ncbi:MAG: aldolase/citrate lyase family protein [Candidatus Dormiibacterota bacterium]
MYNRVKEALARGDHVLGAGVGFIRSPAVIGLIADAGYDFVSIDMQHSSLSMETVADMCEMARGMGLTSVVRPYSRDGELGNRIQSLGARGLMHPDVHKRSEVEQLLGWMRYPPDGTRGSFTGMSSVHETRQPEDINAALNAEMLLVIQVERRDAVDHIDEILDGGGVDVVEVGRNDLAQSYGHPGERRHPDVLAAMEKIVAACTRHNCAAGAGCDSPEDVAMMIGLGVRYVIYPSGDFSLLRRAYAEGNEVARSYMGGGTAKR